MSAVKPSENLRRPALVAGLPVAATAPSPEADFLKTVFAELTATLDPAPPTIGADHSHAHEAGEK